MIHDEIIFLEPYFDIKIWGGQKLKDFGYNIPSKTTGEAWLISAIKDKSSVITNSSYNNMSLYDFFNKYRDEFFGSYPNEFPLLAKIIDANDDLSVQVHPNNEYAKKHHNKLGKTECWYILDCKKEASIVYGHNAKNRQEMESIIKNNQWEKILKIEKTHKSDFFFVPSGTVHAIGKGNLIFELQQSSDVTYRLYDYNRKEKDGSYRDLHIEDSLNVIDFPFKKPLIKDYRQKEGYLVYCDLFKLKKIDLNNTTINIPAQKYWIQGTIIDGKCEINNINAKKGNTFISKANTALTISGNATLLLSWI